MVIVTPAIRKIYKDLIKQVVEDLHKPILVFSPPEKEDCPNCFEAGTLVDTPFGPKQIETVSIGDLVFDGKGRSREVTRLYKRTDHLSMVALCTHGNNIGITGTSNHKVPVYSNIGTLHSPIPGDRAEKKLSEIDKGDLLFKANVPLPTEPLKYIEVAWRDNKFGPKKKLSPTIEVTDDFLFSYGLFLAEGCILKGRQVQYCLNTDEIDLGERVCKYWGDLLGVSYTLCSRVGSDKNAVFELYSSHLAEFMDTKCGHLAQNKSICPDLYYRLDKRQTKVMIDAIYDGDGHYEKQYNSYVLTQTSRVLAYQVYNLLLSSGYSASILNFPSKVGKDGIHRKETFSVRYWPTKKLRGTYHTEEGVYQVVKRKDTICKTTTVHNLEVSVEHSYIASGFSVNNCKWDSINKTSSGKFQDSFVTPVVIFGNTISPNNFQRGRCPVCYGVGYLAQEIKRNVKALVKWNPSTAEDIESLPVGREGAARVRIKVLRADFTIINDATYFVVDGVRCETIKPPTIRGLGTQEELVIAFLQEVEPGKDVKK